MYLNAQTATPAVRLLLERFTRWGYSRRAVAAQLRALVNKDLVWTTAGAPDDVTEHSRVRLSYRGLMFLRKCTARSVFNYMAGFSVSVQERDHPLARAHKSEFYKELKQAQQDEQDRLSARGCLSEFTEEVAGSDVPAIVRKGLSNLLAKVVKGENPASDFQLRRS